MAEKQVHIVQQFESVGKTRKVVPGRTIQARSADDAVARAERDATRFPGVVALTQLVDDDTGEILEDPRILFTHGTLSAEFASYAEA